MPVQHGTIAGDAIHVPYAGTFANAAARTGATGLDSTQHGKLFRQLDDDSLWMLVNTSPLTWKSLSPDRVASAGYADNAGYANNAGNAGTLNGKAEGDLSVNYAATAGSAGSVSAIGGALVSGSVGMCGKKFCVYAPSGGQYAVLYGQKILVAKKGAVATPYYIELIPGRFAGGQVAAQTPELDNTYKPTTPTPSPDFYRI